MPSPSPQFSSVAPSGLHALRSLMGSLLLRPLVWMCACALLGMMLGGRFAHSWSHLSREQVPLWWLLPFLPLGLAGAWYFRHSPWKSRLGVALVVVTFFAGYTARRLLAPRTDISRVFANQPKRDEPLRESPLRIVGLIGDYPSRSRWNIRFPLDVEEVNGGEVGGRIWMTASFDSRLEVGDRMEVRAPIRPLHRPTNVGERESFWSAVAARCWCENGPILELQVLSPGAAYPLERRIQAIRRALQSRYETMFAGDENTLAKRPFPHQNAALLTAMVWGESGLREPLPEQTRDDFRAAGLSHLLVASGSQVTATVPAYFRGLKLGWGYERPAHPNLAGCESAEEGIDVVGRGD